MSANRSAKAGRLKHLVLDFLQDEQTWFSFLEFWKEFCKRKRKVTYKALNKTVNNLHNEELVNKENKNLGFMLKISPKGSEVYRRFVGGVGSNVLVRSHNLLFRCLIRKRPTGAFRDGFFMMNQEMRNWKNPQYYQNLKNGTHVQITDNLVLVRIKEILCDDVNVAVMQAYDRVLEVISLLHNKYVGLLIGCPDTVCDICTQHHAIHSPPVSEFVADFRIKYKDDSFQIDYSTGKYPEIECIHPETAQSDAYRLVEFLRDVASGKFDWKKIMKEVNEENRDSSILE